MSIERSGLSLAGVALASLVSLVGCHGDDHSHDGDVSCQGDEDVQGDVIAGANMKVVLTRVPDPVDPEVELDFTITVTDGADAPLDGVTVEAEPWQDVHGHGVPLEPDVAAGANSGEYDISKVYFLHPGRWELRFHLTNGSDMETITAFICVAGVPPEEF